MIGGSGSGSNKDLSNYLINFNAADWANAANAHLQQALSQGLGYSEKYAQQAVNALQGYDNKAQQQIQQGFQQAQALNAPQRLAAYNALDAYQNLLGLPTVTGGSANMVNQSMSNSGLFGTPQQQQPMSMPQQIPITQQQQTVPVQQQQIAPQQQSFIPSQVPQSVPMTSNGMLLDAWRR